MLVTASLHSNEAMDKLAAAHESAGDVERAESLYLRMLAWREGADRSQAGIGDPIDVQGGKCQGQAELLTR